MYEWEVQGKKDKGGVPRASGSHGSSFCGSAAGAGKFSIVL